MDLRQRPERSKEQKDGAMRAEPASPRLLQALDTGEARVFRSALLHRLALLDHARGWVQQYHVGAMRNNNTRMRKLLGPDTGFDSIADVGQARPPHGAPRGARNR